MGKNHDCLHPGTSTDCAEVIPNNASTSKKSAKIGKETIEIQFDDVRKVTVNKNNKAVILQLKELVIDAMKNYLPKIESIHNIIASHKSHEEELFNQINHLKDKLSDCVDKYSKIRLVTASGTTSLIETLSSAIENFKEPVREQKN